MLKTFKGNVFLPFVATLALVLTVHYSSYISGQATFYLGDASLIFEPIARFIHDSMQSGDSPFWNPYASCGESQLAYPLLGLFYPFNLLFFIFPFSQALALSMIFHQTAAGAGAYLLTKEFGWRKEPAVIAGLIFSLNAYMFSLAINFSLVATITWLPFCLTSSLKLLRGKKEHFVPLALFSALMITAGRPEIFAPSLALCLLTIVLWLIFPWRNAETKSRLVMASSALAALAAGVMLAAPGVLPVLEWLNLSLRGAGMSSIGQLNWSAIWYDFFCLFLFQPLGDPFASNIFAPLLKYKEGFSPLLISSYLSPAVFMLSLAAFFDRSWRWRYLVAALFAITAICAAGDQTPLFPAVISAIPALKIMRYPVKLFGFLTLILAITSARAVQQRLQEGSLSRLQLIITGAVMFLILIAAVITTNSVDLSRGILEWLSSYVGPENAEPALRRISDSAALAAVLGIVCQCTIMLQKKYSKIGAYLLILQLSLPLLLWSQKFKYEGPADFYERRSYAADQIKSFASRQNIEESFIQLSPPLLKIPPLIESSPWKLFLKLDFYQKQLLACDTSIHYRIRSLFPYTLADTAELSILEDSILPLCGPLHMGLGSDDLPLYRLCQMTGTQFAVSQIDSGESRKSLNADYFRVIAESQELNIRLYQSRNSLPHVCILNDWKIEKDRTQILESIINCRKSEFDPLKAAIVHKRLSTQESEILEPDPDESARSAPASDKNLRILLRRNDKITISAENTHNALLQLNDSFYPGWKATVDGKAATIFRVDAICRGVFLKPGKHLIDFKYEPDSLRWGIACSIAGLLICLIFFWKSSTLPDESSKL